MVEDLQERLEEARAEIALKRKDEKDYKSKDRAQLIQIAGVCRLQHFATMLIVSV